MNRLVALFTALVFAFVTTAAHAQECVEPIPLQTPCKGVLLPTQAAAEGLSCLKIGVPKLKLNVAHTEELFQVRINSLEKRLAIEQAHSKEMSLLFDKALENGVSTSSAWEHPVLWAVLGLVIGASATIGIAYAIGDARN